MRRATASESYPIGVSADTEDVLEPALGWLDDGRAVAIATVLRTWGSSPRPVGSQLAVNDRGAFVGSVSGGCVEAATVQAALDLFEHAGPRRLEFGVADDDAWRVGLACGGKIEMLVQDIGPERALLEQLVCARRERRAVVLAIELGTGRARLIHSVDEAGELAGAVQEAFDRDTSALSGDWFVRVYAPKLRLFVVGAVHVAVPLAKMALLLGFDVVVVDPRSAFATAERFAGIDVCVDWPDAALRDAIDRRSAVVVLSHDPKIDDPALDAGLRSGAFYVGALGSRRTHAARLERLAGRGHSPEAVAAIRGPVGLDIGARTAAEIATSIVAEIVRTLRQGPRDSR